MKKLLTLILVAAAAMTGSAIAQTSAPYAPLSTDIKAKTPHSAYVQDARGVIARDPFGLCWRTGYWTPADAVQGCDLPLCKDNEVLKDGVCVVPPPVCTPPAELKDGKCVTPPPVCAAGQILKDGVCITPAPVCAAPAVMTDGKCLLITSEKVSIAADALFDFDKAVLKPEGKAKLDDLASKLGSFNLEVIIAVGHTDSVGSDAYNQKLSVRRAEAVKAYLQGKGVEANRVYTEGKGEKQPVADNKNADGRSKNRRVEIEVVGTRKVTTTVTPTNK